jgi:cystathionine gamma-synthase
MRPETMAVHVGVDKDHTHNSVITPIYATSTFAWTEECEPGEYRYSRAGNPTRAALQENLAALEGGTAAWATASGMAAITAVAFLLRQGDHVVGGRDLYGGTYRLFQDIMPQFGVTTSLVDMCDVDEVRAALRPETRLLWIETPSNPLLRITDIRAMVGLARERGLLTVADNTFLSPYFQRPLDLGVDVAVHSTTKYLNGHSDVVGGAVITGRDDLAERLALIVYGVGLGCSPFDAWLVLRGVKTLAPRMEAHQRGARAVAAFLQRHPLVQRVYYPGLPEHPGHELASSQQSGFGGMLSFELDTAALAPSDFLTRLRFFSVAGSLGGVESLVAQPWRTSHANMPDAAKREAGISPGTIRLSVGIEHPDDLLEDLDQALHVLHGNGR